MKATFMVANQDELQATMTITLPLRAWRQLAAQLESNYPEWQLRSVINQMVHDLSTTIYAEPKEIGP